ncbi:MAG: MarR family transcriptional regulator [Candidatus Gastranaerophilales bacterium]|nr:MarR family transcriptional regulator [Candidatus Gastranaerophilales bacterium]
MEKKYIPYSESVMYAAGLITKAAGEIARKIYKKMDFGINHEEFLILETIYLNPGIIQINIAKNILMKRSYVCKFLNQLEEKKLIRKENAIRGKRQVIIENYITDKGEETYLKAKNFIENSIIEKSDNYDYDEVRKVTAVLLNLTAKLKKDFNLKY